MSPPMDNRFLCPRRKVAALHPEASAWSDSVAANGGTASASTLSAVSAFCTAIDAAGLRNRFYRLSLCAGDGLLSALVPLYRGPVAGGTTYGNTTDSNNGPFVSGDYSEATGLTTSGGKYLDTGLPANFSTDRHASVYYRSSTSYYRRIIGTNDEAFVITSDNPASKVYGIGWSGAANLNTGVSTSASNTASDGDVLTLTSYGSPLIHTYYENAVAFAPANSAGVPASTLPMYVFSSSNAGPSATSPMAGALYGYSFGVGMSVADLTLYKSAVSALATALGRTP